MKLNDLFLFFSIVFFSTFLPANYLNAQNKWYPIALSNKYSINVSYKGVDDCNKEAPIETINSGGMVTLGYATFNDENKTVIIQQTPNDPTTTLTGLCVASAYLGYQLGGYQTNLKTEWDGLNTRLLYAFLNNKTIRLIHIILTPNVEYQGIWQWSPYTPFEAKVEIKYD